MKRPILGFCNLPWHHDGPHHFVPIYAGPSSVFDCNARGPETVVTVEVQDTQPTTLTKRNPHP